MASSINATKPTTGSPTTQSVRDNFSAAKDEINGLLRSSLDVVTTTGTGTAYSANFSNNVAKAEGARIIVKAHTANTGSATLNVDGTGASTIRSTDGTTLSAGQIAGSNHYLDLVYNSANNSWVLLNPNELDTARLIALGGDATGSTSFDGSQNVTITTVVDKLLPYPVGAIYTSVLSTSPASLFGGTWVAFGAGRVLVGINSSDSDFDQSQETGGAKTVALSIAEMPAHTHTDSLPIYTNRSSSSGSRFEGTSSSDLVTNWPVTTNSTGGGAAHENMPPYIVVYMWKRTV